MMDLKIDELGQRVIDRRGPAGVRAAAKEIGISAATLSRIENGHVPDLETFARICAWLGEDPSKFLGLPRTKTATMQASVHLRKKRTTSVKTATALGHMILAAQAALNARDDL
jgi:transcriptional regulator with XRE-family HTH domain